MLESFTIKNFRSCENTSIRLNEPVIALVGKNGVGKTNLLHAIQLVADLCVGERDSTFVVYPRDHSSPTEFKLAFTVNSVKCEYHTKRGSRRSKNGNLEESLMAGGTTLYHRVGETIRTEKENLPDLEIGVRTSALSALLQLLPQSHELKRELDPIDAYLRSVRYQPLIQGFQEHVTGPLAFRVMGEFRGDLSPVIEVSKYEAWKAEQKDGPPSRSVQLRLLDLYLTDNEGWQELAILLGEDGLGLIQEIEVQDVMVRRSNRDEAEPDSEEGYVISFIPCAGLAGAGRSFRFRGLSAGTWRVVQLATYLIYDKYSCMLIEQPEDSIHAGLLAKVIDILRTYSGGTQLVCTTHSPRVMNLVGPSSIRFVTADNGRTRVSELTGNDLKAAQAYLEDEGTLSEFLETLGED